MKKYTHIVEGKGSTDKDLKIEFTPITRKRRRALGEKGINLYNLGTENFGYVMDEVFEMCVTTASKSYDNITAEEEAALIKSILDVSLGNVSGDSAKN